MRLEALHELLSDGILDPESVVMVQPATPSGALVLSEFAGAAAELQRAFVVDPHDLDDVKHGLDEIRQLPSRSSRPTAERNSLQSTSRSG